MYGFSRLDTKKATINKTSKGDKCFQYTATAALNYKKIKGVQKEFQASYHL